MIRRMLFYLKTDKSRMMNELLQGSLFRTIGFKRSGRSKKEPTLSDCRNLGLLWLDVVVGTEYLSLEIVSC